MKAVLIRTAGCDPYDAGNKDLNVFDYVYVPGKIIVKGFMDLCNLNGSIIDHSDEKHVGIAAAIFNRYLDQLKGYGRIVDNPDDEYLPDVKDVNEDSNGLANSLGGNVADVFSLSGADVAQIVRVVPGHVRTKIVYDGSSRGLVDILTGHNLRKGIIDKIKDAFFRRFG